MAAGAATAYDPAQDAAESGSSDLELDAESQQELPNAEDFGGAASALGKRGSVLRTHPLQIGSRVSCRAGLFDGLTAKWSELTFRALFVTCRGDKKHNGRTWAMKADSLGNVMQRIMLAAGVPEDFLAHSARAAGCAYRREQGWSSSFIRNNTGIDPAPIARYKLHT